MRVRKEWASRRTVIHPLETSSQVTKQSWPMPDTYYHSLFLLFLSLPFHSPFLGLLEYILFWLNWEQGHWLPCELRASTTDQYSRLGGPERIEFKVRTRAQAAQPASLQGSPCQHST